MRRHRKKKIEEFRKSLPSSKDKGKPPQNKPDWMSLNASAFKRKRKGSKCSRRERLERGRSKNKKLHDRDKLPEGHKNNSNNNRWVSVLKYLVHLRPIVAQLSQ